MASARRVGTNESISTYAASGADYSDLATWEAATDNDNVTGTVSPVLECAEGQYDDVLAMNAATNNATYFRIVRPNSSSFHTGVRDTGVRFYSTADGNCVNLADTNDQLQDVCLRVTNNSATARSAGVCNGASTDAAYVGVIATNSQNAGTGSNFGLNQLAAATNRNFYIDCLSENNEGTQFIISDTASLAPIYYNCTAIGGVLGFNFQTNATTTAINCLAHGTSTADFFGTLDAGSNNASEDATALGTSPRTSQTFTFRNAAVFDYHLQTRDAGARSFGTPMDADATYPFDDDIDRQRWTIPWNIGFDSISQPPSPTIALTGAGL